MNRTAEKSKRILALKGLFYHLHELQFHEDAEAPLITTPEAEALARVFSLYEEEIWHAQFARRVERS